MLPKLTPEEAAAMINHGDFVGVSAFTPAGSAKVVPAALAKRAKAMHDRGEPMAIRILTGASTGKHVDEALSAVDAISWRTPYQSSKTLREKVNTQEAKFVDLHLSHVGPTLEYGFFGEMDLAIVEAINVTEDGRIYCSTSQGATPSILRCAKKVIVEVNDYHHKRLAEMHDVAQVPKPPRRSPIPIRHPLDKIGTPFISIDPKKIIGVVSSNESDGVAPFVAPDDVSNAIADHVVEFILHEIKVGRIPKEFLPLQAGVGNVANAVMAKLGICKEIHPFYMYTEVFQDALLDLMEQGKLLGASTSSLTLSDAKMERMYADMDFFCPRLVIRPTELSNNPEVVRRLGVIAINTVLEMDIYGHANSTHVNGTKLMNGVGGSGDFVRNAYLSILVAPSIAKGGKISTVVPMCTHVDHNEHSVQILVTDQGLADLRGLGPVERANVIIEKCAHPMYRDYLRDYIKKSPLGHLRHDLSRCFELHQNLMKTGTMLPSEG